MSNAADKKTAMAVVRELRGAGFLALFAGGCVRDMLLGVRSSDYDVATDATPEQVRKLFRHVLLVGAKFGVAMVIVHRRKVEVTTFRSEDSYSDGRRPDHVRFTTAREDALRRDFTINGMFADPLTGEIIDYVGGREDLRGRVVRTIGEADQRFGEDYLRMIRAVRFAVRLEFRLDEATAAAIQRHAAKIASISGERVFDEMQKMLARPSAANALRMLAELGLARHIVPELHARPGLWEKAVARVQRVAGNRVASPVLPLCAMLAELPREDIGRVIRRWGGSNEIRDAAWFVAANLDGWPNASEFGLAEFKKLLGNRDWPCLKAVWAAEEYLRTRHVAAVRKIARRAKAIPEERIAPPPLLTGADLKKLGLREGPALGKILKALYEAQLNEEIAGRKEAMELAQRMVRQQQS